MPLNAKVGGKFGGKTRDKLEQMRRGTVIKLFSAVIMDTPVLSGRLRANWKFSEGDLKLSTSQRTDKTGDSTLRQIEAGVLASTPGKPLFLSNSLPYAARIEYEGWSHTKAPEGMVRKNVARFNQLIKAEAAK